MVINLQNSQSRLYKLSSNKQPSFSYDKLARCWLK